MDGQPEAFSDLVARYERRLYGLLWRLCGDRAALEDLYQQVWMRAWSGRLSFQGRSRFGTWLYAIALNEVRAWRRRRRETVPLDSIADPPHPAPSVLDRLLGWARRDAVQGGLESLTPADREILVLRYQQDLDPTEIARLTRTSPAQARLRSFRALRRLKEKLKDMNL